MTNSIKECPFCGGKASRAKKCVSCDKCGAQGPYTSEDTYDDACENDWNDRHEHTKASDQPVWMIKTLIANEEKNVWLDDSGDEWIPVRACFTVRESVDKFLGTYPCCICAKKVRIYNWLPEMVLCAKHSAEEHERHSNDIEVEPTHE